MKIDSSELVKLLRRVCLGGIIEETVVNFDTSTVQAVDATNSIFLKVFGGFKLKKFGKVGFNDLSNLCKYLDTMKGEVDIELAGNRFNIKTKDRGELNYLTVDPEFVTTAVEKKNPEQLIEAGVVTCPITEDIAKNILTYASFVKAKAVDFSVTAEDVTIQGGLESEHQFKIPVGTSKWLVKKKQTFSTKVYSAHLFAVLNILEWGDDYTPTVYLAPSLPAIIQLDKENFWALLPLTEKPE